MLTATLGTERDKGVSLYLRESAVPGAPPAASAPPPTGERPCSVLTSAGGVVAENMTMDVWARFITLFPQINANVVNRTGLDDAFDIRLPLGDAGAPNLLPPVEPSLERELGLACDPLKPPWPF